MVSGLSPSPEPDDAWPTHGRSTAWAAFSLAIIGGDAAALSFWLSGRLATAELFGLHMTGAGLMLALGALFFPRRAHPSLLIEVGFFVLCGPLGALVMQVARIGSARADADATDNPSVRMAETDAALSLPDAIHDLHVQGRRSTRSRSEDWSYADILRDDDLARHNEVIAAISRNYHPEMYPALSLALGSSSPALKVQAAAVYSKLRRTFGESANDLLRTDPALLTQQDVAVYHEDLLRVANSGFVDAHKVQSLTERAKDIAALGLLAGHAPAGRGLLPASARSFRSDVRRQGPRLKRYSCGGLG